MNYPCSHIKELPIVMLKYKGLLNSLLSFTITLKYKFNTYIIYIIQYTFGPWGKLPSSPLPAASSFINTFLMKNMQKMKNFLKRKKIFFKTFRLKFWQFMLFFFKKFVFFLFNQRNCLYTIFHYSSSLYGKHLNKDDHRP